MRPTVLSFRMRCNMLTILSVLLVMDLYLRSMHGWSMGEILVYSIPEQLVGPRIISRNTLLAARYKSTRSFHGLCLDKSFFTGEGFSNIEIVTK